MTVVSRHETGMRWLPATSTLVELPAVALVVVAEAAWISVLAGLLQEVAFHEPVLGIPELAAFVLAGGLAARLLGRRLGMRWPAVGLSLIVSGAVIGWLMAPGARAALGNGIGPAVAAHPGGLIAGLAVLRGFAHARLPLAEGTLTHLFALGVPGLVLLTMVGGAIAEPFRGRFLADALTASVVFVVAVTLALALARLTTIGRESGFDWRRNPVWLGSMLALLAFAIAAALPLSVVAGAAIQTLLTASIAPLLIVGFVAGFDRAARRVILIFAAVAVVVYILVVVFGAGATPNRPATTGAGGLSQPTTAQQVMTLILAGLLLLAGIAAVLVLTALWMRRARPPNADLVLESRTIDRGADGPHRRRRSRRFGRRHEPTTAVAAYIALIDDLDRRPDVRREPAETPAEHAARVRAEGRADLSLDLLAADYALARYGGAHLPARENRRAIDRWRRLRRSLVKAAPTGGETSSWPPTERHSMKDDARIG